MAMLPARMRRLLLGGHRDILAQAIDALHEAGAVHIEDYRDPEDLTRIGSPLERGSKLAEQVVRVRSLQKNLDAEEDQPAGTPGDIEDLLRQAEGEATPVLAELNRHRTELAHLGTERDLLRPYVGLEVDVGLLTSLRSVRGFLGTARRMPDGLSSLGDVSSRPYGAGVALAAIVPAVKAGEAARLLAESGFTAAQVPPGASGTPAARVRELESRLHAAEAAAAAEEARVRTLRLQWGPRLAAATRQLETELEKAQAPLRFGVTRSTFHVEGWVPADRVAKLQQGLQGRFGERLYVHDLGEAHDATAGHGSAALGHGVVPAGKAGAGHGDAGHGGAAHGAHGHGEGHGEAHGDEHHHDDPSTDPPVKLQNPKAARPYEWMLGLLAKPRYQEVDPTLLMLVFFPLFFGLMVGDLVVGLAIVALGVYLKTHKIIGIGGPAVGRALVAGGIVAAVLGVFVFGEALGIHFVVGPEQEEHGEMSWEQILGLHIPFEDEDHGLLYKTGSAAEAHGAGGGHGDPTQPLPDPTDSHTAPSETDEHGAAEHGSGGILAPSHHTHLSLGGIVNLGYYSKLADALALLVWSVIIGVVHIVLGLLIGIRNVAKRHGAALAIQEKAAWLTLMGGAAMAIVLWGGFLGYAGLGVAIGSLVLLYMGATKVFGMGFIALLEIPSLIGNIVSYTRLAAIGASKAGLGLALGVISFETVGGGDIHSVAGWILYVVGFVGILFLAVLSAGLQSLRLQFVEFFGKFFEGGGRPYLPFGRRAA